MLSPSRTVIRKERPCGARHGKTEAQKEHFVTHNARKRCIKHDFDGIHDRFQRDPVNRDSQLKNWLDRGERDRKTGVSHWTNQAKMHRWNSDQTSEKQSQFWTVSTANLEKSDLSQSLFINTKGDIRLLQKMCGVQFFEQVVQDRLLTQCFQVNACKLRRFLDIVDLENSSRFAWAYKSTCVMTFLCGSNRCLGAVLWPFPFVRHTWSSRTLGRSTSRSENEEGRKLLTTGTARLLVKDEEKTM